MDLPLLRSCRRDASRWLRIHTALGNRERAASIRAEIAGYDAWIDGVSEAWIYLGMDVPSHE